MVRENECKTVVVFNKNCLYDDSILPNCVLARLHKIGGTLMQKFTLITNDPMRKDSVDIFVIDGDAFNRFVQKERPWPVQIFKRGLVDTKSEETHD